MKSYLLNASRWVHIFSILVLISILLTSCKEESRSSRRTPKTSNKSSKGSYTSPDGYSAEDSTKKMHKSAKEKEVFREKQTATPMLKVDKSELEFKVDMDKSGRQNAYRIYIGFKEKESDVYAEFPQGKKIKISEELRIVNVDEVIREIEGGQGLDNNALQQAAETFAKNIIEERGPGSELANFDVILTVARHAPIKTVLEVKQALAEQGFKRVFHRMKEDEDSEHYSEVSKDLPEEQEQEINTRFLLVIQQKASKYSTEDCSPDNLFLQVEYSYAWGNEISSQAAIERDIRENASIYKNGSELLDETIKRVVGSNIITWNYQPVQLGSDELNVIKEIVANHIRKQKGEHIIQFKYKDGVCYQHYMTMFQTIEAAYEEVRNETSQEIYGIGWDELKVKASKEPKAKEDLNRPNGWREKEANIYKLVSTSKLSKQVVN